MINKNVRPALVDYIANCYTITICDAELTKLVYKHGEVNIKISKPEKPGSERQNRAMHGLLAEYYKTGFHSCPEPCTLAEFKIYMKLAYGPVYNLFYNGQEVRVPKSWADYSNDERRKLIDGLISECRQSGAYAEKEEIRQIIDGMSDEFKGE